MDRITDRFRSEQFQSNRWIIPAAGFLLAALTIGLAVMFVAPRLRNIDFGELADEGRGIRKRARNKVGMATRRIKNKVEDVQGIGKRVVDDTAETIQDQAAKVKKAARRKANS